MAPYLLEVFAKPAFQKLGIFVEQCEEEIVEHGHRVAPTLVSLRVRPR